jgi:hypothetical protein
MCEKFDVDYTNINKDVNAYFIFDKRKNGTIEIYHKEYEIYDLMVELGFGKTKVDKKNVLFRIVKDDIFFFAFEEIRYFFDSFLKGIEFENIHEEISKNDILNYHFKHSAKRKYIIGRCPFVSHLNHIELSYKKEQDLILQMNER